MASNESHALHCVPPFAATQIPLHREKGDTKCLSVSRRSWVKNIWNLCRSFSIAQCRGNCKKFLQNRTSLVFFIKKDGDKKDGARGRSVLMYSGIWGQRSLTCASPHSRIFVTWSSSGEYFTSLPSFLPFTSLAPRRMHQMRRGAGYIFIYQNNQENI